MNDTSDIPRLVIQARARPPLLGLGELWTYRELLYFLIWRDVKVRYKQTVLGAAWAILQPLATAAVFTVFFGKLAGVPSDGVPYPLFAYVGMLLWTFFAQAVGGATVSLVGSASLLTKVFFPRSVIPLAAVSASFVDFLVASPVLVVMLFHYGVRPGLRALALPGLVLMAIVAATGVGLWLSALNVAYRDVRHAVPFLIQLWLFVTPVIYPASSVAPFLTRLGVPAWLYGLNPMAGVVEGARWLLLDPPTDPIGLVATGAAAAVALLVSGLLYFRSVERSFADVV